MKRSKYVVVLFPIFTLLSTYFWFDISNQLELLCILTTALVMGAVIYVATIGLSIYRMFRFKMPILSCLLVLISILLLFFTVNFRDEILVAREISEFNRNGDEFYELVSAAKGQCNYYCYVPIPSELESLSKYGEMQVVHVSADDDHIARIAVRRRPRTYLVYFSSNENILLGRCIYQLDSHWHVCRDITST